MLESPKKNPIWMYMIMLNSIWENKYWMNSGIMKVMRELGRLFTKLNDLKNNYLNG
uniref:Uncharacterized protein n=1 Tax=Helianthus annuus TaxID=4232 RepID=A0A251S6R5_HELAN